MTREEFLSKPERAIVYKIFPNGLYPHRALSCKYHFKAELYRSLGRAGGVSISDKSMQKAVVARLGFSSSPAQEYVEFTQLVFEENVEPDMLEGPFTFNSLNSGKDNG